MGVVSNLTNQILVATPLHFMRAHTRASMRRRYIGVAPRGYINYTPLRARVINCIPMRERLIAHCVGGLGIITSE